LKNWNKSAACIYTGNLRPTEKLSTYQEENIHAKSEERKRNKERREKCKTYERAME
jgi:hypothetical protein